MALSERERFISFVGMESLKKSDAIIALEGDGFSRLPHAAQLFKDGWAPLVLFSGNYDNRQMGAFPAAECVAKLIQLGVPASAIEVDYKSLNTRDQAVEVLTLGAERGWKRILLVATHYHQYRAFLTFLQVLGEKNLKIDIVNAPARDPDWFESNSWGRRFDLLEQEFVKIDTYSKEKGHCASFETANKYFQDKEKD